ncbi:pacearchaeosortase [Candidatus Woesearchaeota archaeon]|nr:pacearchaeosortase [Candidatus Woesearchaeota archaeon]
MNYYGNLIIRLAVPFIISYQFLNKIFYNATIYFPYFFMKLINFQVIMIRPYLVTQNNYIRFSEACAAVSAYFLLLLLIVFTMDMKLKARTKIFLIGSLIIFSANMIRILLLIFILEKKGFNAFQQVHDVFWIIFGSIIVALTWIFLTRFYKIKSIPIYTDVKYLLKQTKLFK